MKSETFQYEENVTIYKWQDRDNANGYTYLWEGKTPRGTRFIKIGSTKVHSKDACSRRAKRWAYESKVFVENATLRLSIPNNNPRDLENYLRSCIYFLHYDEVEQISDDCFLILQRSSFIVDRLIRELNKYLEKVVSTY